MFSLYFERLRRYLGQCVPDWSDSLSNDAIFNALIFVCQINRFDRGCLSWAKCICRIQARRDFVATSGIERSMFSIVCLLFFFVLFFSTVRIDAAATMAYVLGKMISLRSRMYCVRPSSTILYLFYGGNGWLKNGKRKHRDHQEIQIYRRKNLPSYRRIRARSDHRFRLKWKKW